MIGFQASKVRTFDDTAETLTATTLQEHLVLFARDLLYGAGYVSVAFIALALFVTTLTKPRPAVALST